MAPRRGHDSYLHRLRGLGLLAALPGIAGAGVTPRGIADCLPNLLESPAGAASARSAEPRLAEAALPVLLQREIATRSRVPPGGRFHIRCGEPRVSECRSKDRPRRPPSPEHGGAGWLRGRRVQRTV